MILAWVRSHRRWAIGISALAILGLAALFTVRELEIAQLHRQIAQVEAEQGTVRAANADLKAQLARKDDLDYLEYLARKELGLTLPGEDQYILLSR